MNIQLVRLCIHRCDHNLVDNTRQKPLFILLGHIVRGQLINVAFKAP